MSLNYEEYVKKAQNNNKLSGLEITLDKELLDDKDYDFFHYQQSYELAKCDYGTFYIASRGELRCDYFDDNGKWIESAIDTIQNYYVRNNEEFNKAIDSNKFYLDMNNWFSIEFIDNNGDYLEYCDFLDNVYGSISECLLCFVEDWLEDEELIEEIIKGENE